VREHFCFKNLALRSRSRSLPVEPVQRLDVVEPAEADPRRPVEKVRPREVGQAVGKQEKSVKKKMFYYIDRGPMLWFLKYFRRKLQRKYWRF
jgi:hypothetical protein